MDGLRIDPCLPLDWTRAKMMRTFRGAAYGITIEKPEGICIGHVTVELDGQVLPDNFIPPQGDGSSHEVIVVVP